MDNLFFWNLLSTPPANTLKKITGGRLSGMTDIKPQWRYQVMTETYGPCGLGWKYAVIKKWSEPGSDGNVFAFADIELFVKYEGEWSDPIPGHGGSMLLAKEKAGVHSSDEAYKMAITDALSTAMKMLGVAADIYLGNWDGSKYKNQNQQPSNKKNNASTGTAPKDDKFKRYKNRLVEVAQYGIIYTKKSWDQTPSEIQVGLGQPFKNWLFSKAENCETEKKLNETPDPTTSLKGKFKPAENQNPLHKTPEWQEWLDTVEAQPEVCRSMMPPTTPEQCLEAVKRVKETVDMEAV